LITVVITVDNVITDWNQIYAWCCQNGTAKLDFQMYWGQGVLIVFFKRVEFALMFKLRWG
jgi:hypothetical protein